MSLFCYIVLTTKDYKELYTPDTNSYVRAALTLVSSGSFNRNNVAEIVRTPGYPILLIPGILLNKIEFTAVIIQIFLSCLSIILVYKITLIIFNNNYKLSLLSAFLYAIEPLSIIYSLRLMSESLFVFLLLISLYYFILYLKYNRLWSLIVSSIILAATVYVRPISYFLPLGLSIILLYNLTKVRQKKSLFVHIIIYFTITYGIVGLWQIRNKILAGYSGFSAVTDVNLYLYQGAAVLASKENVPIENIRKQMNDLLANETDNQLYSQSNKYLYMREKGLNIIQDNLLLYTKIHIRGMINILFSPGALDLLALFNISPKSSLLGDALLNKGFTILPHILIKFINNEKAIIVISTLLFGCMLIIYLISGLISFYFNNNLINIQIITLIFIVIYFLLISGGPIANCRFRHPIMPLISILSAQGLYACYWHFFPAKRLIIVQDA
jgi:hypothetical protein